MKIDNVEHNPRPAALQIHRSSGPTWRACVLAQPDHEIVPSRIHQKLIVPIISRVPIVLTVFFFVRPYVHIQLVLTGLRSVPGRDAQQIPDLLGLFEPLGDHQQGAIGHRMQGRILITIHQSSPNM